MCGIIGYVGSRNASSILLGGLQKLEYRGYDSAGIAIVGSNGNLTVHKQQGKLEALVKAVAKNKPSGTTGLGHTRWATHGSPSSINAHPHTDCSGNVAIIHNGIVENHAELKQSLLGAKHTFKSETDSEVIAHLIEQAQQNGKELVAAVRQAITKLRGAHAIVVADRREPNRLIAARVGHAGGVVIGTGDDESFIASDLPALLPHTRQVVFLEDQEIADVMPEKCHYYDADGRIIQKDPRELPYDPELIAKGNHNHFMIKEIMDQPASILDTIRGRVQMTPPSVELDTISLTKNQLLHIKRVLLVGMGTSYHAAMIGRHFMERIAHLPSEADNASEFRYRDPIFDSKTLMIAVGQSGETVDTLAAMELAARKGASQIAICNIAGSQASRLANGSVYTRCGLEVGVCSTKTFTASIAALYLLACHLGQVRKVIDQGQLSQLLEELGRMPYLVGEMVKQANDYEQLSRNFVHNNHFLFLGRGLQFPVAMEGALKLKEVSYIHAEGYPAGEMKHGPIALIDKGMPVIAIAVRDELYGKMMNNIEQVKARNGTVIALGTKGDKELIGKVDHMIPVPECSPYLMPILTSIPLQLLAYYIAVQRGCDVDQPRNLAKTVTVE